MTKKITEKKLKITLIKSLIGRLPKHILIAGLLGVKRINHSSIHNDTPSTRGLINAINYLLKVEEHV